MPSKDIRDSLKNSGIQIDSNPYTRFDSLETDIDYQYLMNTIDAIIMQYGKGPIITANFIMANPSFDEIAELNYSEYKYELFTDTYRHRDQDSRCIQSMHEAINGGYLVPQFHGREHLNVTSWLSYLQKGHPELRTAFRHKTFGINCTIPNRRSSNLMAAFDYEDDAGFEFVADSIRDGYSLFEDVFGFKSKSIVAPCHVWNERHEFVFNELGIELIQTSLVQLKPLRDGYKKMYHFFGRKNEFGQRYLVRNISFEPATLPSYPWIDKVLRKARIAFSARKPLIISMHRINFSGGIEPSNREANLKLFKELIGNLIEIYPDIEFMSSNELGLVLTNLD